MTGAQVWTLLAMFSGFLTVMCTVFFAMLRTSVGGLRDELVARIDAGDDRSAARIDALDSKIDGLESRLDARIDGLESRLDARIDALDAKLDDRFDRVTAVMDARFDDVDHRLTSVEGDLNLVKGHLIGQRSA